PAPAQISRMVTEADVKGDGRIDYDEFLRAMRKGIAAEVAVERAPLQSADLSVVLEEEEEDEGSTSRAPAISTAGIDSPAFAAMLTPSQRHLAPGSGASLQAGSAEVVAPLQPLPPLPPRRRRRM
ncbi:EF-hand domain-containing protein, partial [Brevundimonas sp.]|uniref:EF-hand domain-containing protein n=1 Tax=Brevundimonas sp. TaxID=1871086 RepID=UPI00391A80D8